MLRDGCLMCTMKHLTQASILLMEVRKGYFQHFLFAIGHLAEAEDECPIQEIVDQIRECRLNVMEKFTTPDENGEIDINLSDLDLIEIIKLVYANIISPEQ